MPLFDLTIKDAARGLAQGEFSAAELAAACLERIRGLDGRLKACLLVDEAGAQAAAAAADRRRQRGEAGPLAGIPFLAKDNIMTAGLITTAASKILENYTAPYDATVIANLNKAGAVLLGKTNLDEFAHGASTENSAFGPTRNPWDPERVPGGSSGGSAAAVAARYAPFALGTDTGGSIRHPASFCGVVGLKPTYGRASRSGLIAMTSSTDVPGPLARSAADAALVLSAIAGHDRYDATTADEPVPDYIRSLEGGIKGMTIGWPEEFFPPDLDPRVRASLEAAADVYRRLGAAIKPVRLPHTRYAVAVYYIITPSEISSNLSRFDGVKYGFSDQEARDLDELLSFTRGRGFGPEAKRRIMLGTFALSAGYIDAYYLKAQKVRTVIARELDRELKNVDAILTPATPHPAFRLGEKGDPLAMYLEDIFMASASLAGLPAVVTPAGFIDRLPIGQQLIGRRFDESTILKIAHAYEEATDWLRQKPAIK